MSLVLVFIGCAIAGAFLSAALARFQRFAAIVDALVMVGITAGLGVLVFLPTLAIDLFGPAASWPNGTAPNELVIAAAAAVVATVFAIRTATVGETSLLFGAVGVWAHVAMAAISNGPLQMFLVMQTASWLGWVEISRRDRSAKTIAGLRWLLVHVAADLPLAFAIVQLVSRYGDPPWAFLNDFTQLAAQTGTTDPAMSFVVLALVCSAAVRLAQFPFSTWLPGVVDTSRIGRSFAIGLLAMPIGLLALERATTLWIVSPVAQLLVLKWGPLAGVAAFVISFGQRTPLALISVATSALMSLLFAASSVGPQFAWASVLLIAASIRPAWTTFGRIVCGLSFLSLFVVIAGPLVAMFRAMEISDHLVNSTAILVLIAAGRATALNRVSEETSDELTHPHWPGLLLLVLGVAVVSANTSAGPIELLASLGTLRIAIGLGAFSVGLIVARFHRPQSDATDSTFVRLARHQFYIDEVIAFGLVLPTRAVSQVVRLIDWSATRTSLLASTAGVMRRLDREGSSNQLDHRSIATAVAVATLALVMLIVTRTT